MRFSQNAVLLTLSFASLWVTAEEESPELSEQFWSWYEAYADEDGNVLDPIDYVRAAVAAEAPITVPEQEGEMLPARYTEEVNNQ